MLVTYFAGPVRAHRQHHGDTTDESDHVVQGYLRERIEKHGNVGGGVRGRRGELFWRSDRRRLVQHRSNHRVLCRKKLLERFLFGRLQRDRFPITGRLVQQGRSVDLIIYPVAFIGTRIIMDVDKVERQNSPEQTSFI